MKRSMLHFVTAALLLALAAGVFAPTTHAQTLTAAERQALLAHLERTRELLLGDVEGLSDAQWHFKAAEDRWSIAECAEHIAKAEVFIRERVEGILETPAGEEDLAKASGNSEKVLPLIVDRSQKFQAPEGLRPTEAAAGDPAQIVKMFKKERKATMKLAKEDRDLRAYAGPHPAFEMLDAYGWLLFLSGHTERHTLQIQEVKEAPGYPKA